MPGRGRQRPTLRALLRALTTIVLVVVAVAPGAAAERYDPRLRFRTLRTPHFDIYFHQGEAALAARLARIVEDVSRTLEPAFGRPAGRVRVILVDQGDLTNGWATPVPYDLIEIQAVPPRAESLLGNTDDWLRLVFTHEYTHVVHLDRSRGWIGGLRRVFGRQPALFPNLFLPQWQIEGLATYEESARTGRGRVEAGDFRVLLTRAAVGGRFLPLDRASGGLIDWPGGTAAYLYGAYFHEFLAGKYGPETLSALADETARRLPYLGTRAFRQVYGRSLGQLWNDFERDTRARNHEAAPGAVTRLTHQGFEVSAPAYDAAGRLYYLAANPHGFPALFRLDGARAEPRRVASRYLGNHTSVTGNLVVFDQFELVRNVGLQSDIYAVSVDGTASRRLTREARAADPDVAPDGRTIVCVVQETGRRLLATFELPGPGAVATPSTLVSEADTEFSSPRWSPDGRTIAAERRRLGGPSELVLVDPQTRAVQSLVASPRGRAITPDWSPDGRRVLFATDSDGAGFRIHQIDIATHDEQRLAGTGDAAQYPTLSPDGRTLAFVGYTPDGYDVFSMALGAASWEPAPASAPAPPTHSTDAAGTETDPPSTPYRPWPTLAPRLWTPLAASDSGEFVAGASTSGSDALGRHAYYAGAGWSASRARPDWEIAYSYDRWWPTLYADYSDDTDPWRDGEVRSREVNAGVVLPVQRVRWREALLAGWHASADAFTCAACTPAIDTTIRRQAVRTGWLVSTAQTYGYSISAETGTTLSATAEITRRALGADGNATATTVDLRQYVPLWPRHAVLAARAAGAWSTGDQRAQRVFSAGGSGPQSLGFGFGTDAIGLLRGYDEDQVAGAHAAVLNVDYRLPLARIERGAGTLPLFLRTIHGAFFADVGNGWDDAFRASDLRKSVGGELSFDVVLGYALPVTFTTGAAWRSDPVAGRRDVVGFARIGRAF